MNKEMYIAEDNPEFVNDLDYFIDQLYSEHLEEIVLYRAVKDKTSGMFWCKEEQLPTEKGSCSVHSCSAYSPRNGKSGICKHHSNELYMQTNQKLVISNYRLK